MWTPTQPIYIVSVNNTPEVARHLVAILIEGLKSEYNLVYLANTDKIDGLKPLLESLIVVPQVLKEVVELAKTIIPGIKTIEIPPGLNATKGGDAVVDFLKEEFIGLGFPTRS
ncbi:hypothetical protein L207DRAFT_568756 [Hyaloscypha variabilis F]|uniref:Uncharacterized protein n=1 Tax=Hyaloscypha variabilis (strain UAMH 11265 / GT02V1 / F) TaxID=1149755 RepID=A0A2J6RDC7_HYAVF|nr:hypothetical protein L207DRAFT_568756 [Hyaloscypha variabilis F]